MLLSPELQRLPPEALDIIRFMDTFDGPADLDVIRNGTGMTERTTRKMIRRLITRYMLEMVDPDVYALSKKGKQGAGELRAVDQARGEEPSTPVKAPAQDHAALSAPDEPGASASSRREVVMALADIFSPSPSEPEGAASSTTPDSTATTPPKLEPVTAALDVAVKQSVPAAVAPVQPPSLPEIPLDDQPTSQSKPAEPAASVVPDRPAKPDAGQREVHRRLSVMMAEEMVDGARSLMLVGFDAASPEDPVPDHPLHVVLHVEASGCEVEPVQVELDLTGRGPAGPVQFRVRPSGLKPVSVRIRVQLAVDGSDTNTAGGIFFKRNVSALPTPQSAELKALGALITLRSQ